jgi:Na+-transporting NADH:ubiquinone oxidoreductase subunit NqrA
MFKIKKGLNLPIAGSPAQQIDGSKTIEVSPFSATIIPV